MANNKELLRSYSYALVLSLMFQVSAWAMCLSRTYLWEHGPVGAGTEALITWRVFRVSCSLYWLGFLAVYLTRRESPSAWRVLYTGLAFPTLFIAATALVPRLYGDDWPG